MSVFFLISLNACCSLHVYYFFLALFQFSLLSQYSCMDETIFHRRSPNRRTISSTCMLIYFLNLPFTFFMNFLSLFLSLSVAMHFIELLAFFQSVRWANLGPVSDFTNATLRNLEKEDSPSSPDLWILAQHWPPRLNYTFLEVSGYLAQRFVKICPWTNSLSQLESHIAQSQ